MKIPYFKNIKDFSLLVISNHSGIQHKSYSLNIWKIAAYVSVYTFAVVLLTFLFFAVTPAKYMFISNESGMKMQNEEMLKLNKRVLALSGELEHITSLNRKLRYAIALGDSNLAKTFSIKDEPAKKNKVTSENKNNNPNGGYLLGVIKRLFFTGYEQHKSDADFVYPVESSFISRGFNAEKGHMGLDFPVKQGLPVFASSGGLVVFADYTAQDGNMIILVHKNNYITVYKHCSVLMKKIREKVVQGETIALSGNTGLNTSGPHLHFELWKDGQAINPEKILTQ